MSGERAYNDLDNFSIDNEPKQKQERWIPGSRVKSISGKVLMFLIFILLSVFFILLVTGVIKCSETNEKVEGFQAQVQTQVSHALSNVSDRSELRKLEERIRNEVSQMGERVLSELSKTSINLINIMNRKLEMLPAHECQNRQCPNNWIHFNGSCYYFSSKKSAWNASSLYCSLRGTHLLTINSEQEQQFATLETQNRRFWVGLADHSSQNQWQWTDGTDYETTPKFWMPGEPSSDHESCVHLWTDGLWNDAPCKGKELFICEMEVQQ